MAGRVAVLGLGTMGSGMAANLLKAGHQVVVFNRTQAKAEPLRALGAEVANSPSEAARNSDFVISMLADDSASREVWLGQAGALEAAGRDTVLIESSTVSPAWVTQLAAAAEARSLQLLDAPVTGSRTQAAAGQLNFLVGGEDATLARATPVLRAMSKEIVHVGPVGSGSKLKLINNFLCGVQVASLAESLAWIERSGLDVSTAMAVLTAGAPGSPLVKTLSERMITGNHETNFLLRLMAKDLLYAEAEARSAGVSLSSARTARELFEGAIRDGYGEADMSAVAAALRRRQPAS